MLIPLSLEWELLVADQTGELEWRLLLAGHHLVSLAKMFITCINKLPKMKNLQVQSRNVSAHDHYLSQPEIFNIVIVHSHVMIGHSVLVAVDLGAESALELASVVVHDGAVTVQNHLTLRPEPARLNRNHIFLTKLEVLNP